MAYTPSNWYWRRADGALWSSAAAAIVPADNPAYLAWTAAGGVPTPWPRDGAGTETGAALRAVLAPFGLAGPPGPATDEEARAECARRILAYASEASQRNLNANFALLATKTGTRAIAETADLAAFDQWVVWVSAMRTKWPQLVASGDPDWFQDAKWPACPQPAIDLAKRF
jgi:hypothetical protein